MVVGGRELIDTLWNVNACANMFNPSAASRINRYIMECKCRLNISFWQKSLELIDTLWNVNLVGVGAASVGVARINRYIMECKYAFAATNDAGGEN